MSDDDNIAMIDSMIHSFSWLIRNFSSLIDDDSIHSIDSIRLIRFDSDSILHKSCNYRVRTRMYLYYDIMIRGVQS